MYKANGEAAPEIGLATKTNFTARETNTFSAIDNTTDLDKIQSVILVAAARPRKVIRVHRCIECGNCFTAARMSYLLVVCRGCLKTLRELDARSRRRKVDRLVAAIASLLRRRLDS